MEPCSGFPPDRAFDRRVLVFVGEPQSGSDGLAGVHWYLSLT